MSDFTPREGPPYTPEDLKILDAIKKRRLDELNSPVSSSKIYARHFQPSVDALRSTVPNRSDFALVRRLRALAVQASQIAQDQHAIKPESDLSMEFTFAVSRVIFPTALNDTERASLQKAFEDETARQQRLQKGRDFRATIVPPPAKMLSMLLEEVQKALDPPKPKSQIK